MATIVDDASSLSLSVSNQDGSTKMDRAVLLWMPLPLTKAGGGAKPATPRWASNRVARAVDNFMVIMMME